MPVLRPSHKVLRPPPGPFEINRASPQAAGLVAWWPTMASRGAGVLQELVTGHNGTFNNTPTWGQDPEIGWGLNYVTGDSDSVRVNNASILNPTTPFTVTAWFRCDTTVLSATNKNILLKGTSSWSAAGMQYQLVIPTYSTDLRLRISNGSAITDLNIAGPIVQGELHFGAGVFDGSNIHVYLGKQGKLLSNSTAWANTPTTSAGTFNIGEGAGDNYWTGFIFDVRLYHRAVSASELFQHFTPATRWELYAPRRRLWTVKAPAAGPQTIVPAGITSGEAFGSLSLQPGAVDVAPSGIASGEALGGPTVQPGAVDVAPSGIVSGEGFGGPLLVLSIAPAGIASAEAIGSLVVQPGAVAVAPTGIASGEGFGTPLVQTGVLFILPSGIASGEAVGGAVVQPGAVAIVPTGIASGEGFGSPVVQAGVMFILPSGIASEETLGGPAVQPGAVAIVPTGIASGEGFGSAVVQAGAVVIVPTGIASGEGFGSPLVQAGVQFVLPSGIVSGEAVGSPSLALWVLAAGIASAEAFGSALVGLSMTGRYVYVVPAEVRRWDVDGETRVHEAEL